MDGTPSIKNLWLWKNSTGDLAHRRQMRVQTRSRSSYSSSSSRSSVFRRLSSTSVRAGLTVMVPPAKKSSMQSRRTTCGRVLGRAIRIDSCVWSFPGARPLCCCGRAAGVFPTHPLRRSTWAGCFACARCPLSGPLDPEAQNPPPPPVGIPSLLFVRRCHLRSVSSIGLPPPSLWPT